MLGLTLNLGGPILGQTALCSNRSGVSVVAVGTGEGKVKGTGEFDFSASESAAGEIAFHSEARFVQRAVRSYYVPVLNEAENDQRFTTFYKLLKVWWTEAHSQTICCGVSGRKQRLGSFGWSVKRLGIERLPICANELNIPGNQARRGSATIVNSIFDADLKYLDGRTIRRFSQRRMQFLDAVNYGFRAQKFCYFKGNPRSLDAMQLFFRNLGAFLRGTSALLRGPRYADGNVIAAPDGIQRHQPDTGGNGSRNNKAPIRPDRRKKSFPQGWPDVAIEALPPIFRIALGCGCLWRGYRNSMRQLGRGWRSRRIRGFGWLISGLALLLIPGAW